MSDEPLTPETREKVQQMIMLEGLYFATDSNKPNHCVPILSMGGKCFSMQIDQELDPERFYNTVAFHGPVPPPFPEIPTDKI